MVKLSLMASAVNSAPILVPDQVLYRAPKDLRVLLPQHGDKLDTLRSSSLKFNSQHSEDLWHPVNLSSYSLSGTPSTMFEKPVLMDVQDSQPDSVRFSFGIAEKCIRHEKIIKFLISGSSVEREGIDVSLLSDLMGLKAVAIDMLPRTNEMNSESFCLYAADMDHSQHLVNPPSYLFVPEPLFSLTSVSALHPDGKFIFINSEADDEDMLSVIAEFNVAKTSSGCKQAMLVPYFTRKGRGRSKANKQVLSSKLETQVVSPLKSPDSIKMKPLQKKNRNRKVTDQRDLYQRNYFHACESLMSFMLDKNKDSMNMVLLKKSSTEIGQLLTKFSAGIAGTGLAIIFSILFKSAYGKVPLSSTRLLSTGFGLGLFWLSSAISKFRDTIMIISKNSNRENFNEEELVEKVDKNMKEIMFRAAALLAVGVMRLA